MTDLIANPEEFFEKSEEEKIQEAERLFLAKSIMVEDIWQEILTKRRCQISESKFIDMLNAALVKSSQMLDAS